MKNDFREFYDESYILHSISSDEGYIEHGLLQKAHKYIKKIKDKYGEWRYIYDLKKKMRKEAGNAGENVAYQMIVDNGSQALADKIAKSKGQKIDGRKRIKTFNDAISEAARRGLAIGEKYNKKLKNAKNHANFERFNKEVHPKGASKEKYYNDPRIKVPTKGFWVNTDLSKKGFENEKFRKTRENYNHKNGWIHRKTYDKGFIYTDFDKNGNPKKYYNLPPLDKRVVNPSKKKKKSK